MDMFHEDQLTSSPGSRPTTMEIWKMYDLEAAEIMTTVPLVGTYLLNKKEKKWEKLDYEGVLYLYRSTIEPYYNLFLLNKLGVAVLKQPVNRHLKMETSKPHLIFKNNLGEIFSFWIYEEKNYMKMHDALKNLLYDINLKALCKEKSMKWKFAHSKQLEKIEYDSSIIYYSSGVQNSCSTEDELKREVSNSVAKFFENASKVIKNKPVPVRPSGKFDEFIRKLNGNPVYKVESIEQCQQWRSYLRQTDD